MICLTNQIRNYNKGENKMNRESKSQSEAIRQNFRKQIRRKQIDDMFSKKRRMMMEQNKMIADILQNLSLESLFNSLKSKSNLQRSLSLLVQFTYTADCLSKTAQNHSIEQMHDLCVQVTHIIFNSLLPSFSFFNEQSQSNRNKCFVIVSNIVADSLAPHSLLIPIISQGIANNFTESNKQQGVQIAWIVANIFCHQLDLSIEGQLEKPIQYLLTFAQDLIVVPNLQVIGLLYTNLNKFFLYIDSYFHAQSQPKCQIQHFKVHRLILLQNTINCNLTIQMGSRLKEIIPFIQNNLNYASCCDQKINETICKKCFAILACGGSDKIMSVTCKLMQKIAKDRDIVIIVIKDYFQILVNILLYQGATLKIAAIQLLGFLCIDQQITEFIADKKGLEFTISQLVKSIRDATTLVKLIQLVKIICDNTNFKCGKEAIKAIEDHLCHKAGQIGQSAIEIVGEYHHHADVMTE